jgi:hypothetical protein
MITMDVFKGDAFQATSMTAAVEKVGYVPNFLGSVAGLFVPPPLGQPRTEAVWIESRGTDAALIQTSPRGAPPKQQGGDRAEARPFKTSRLANSSRITASELQGIRQFGSETELKQLQTEIARRQSLIKSNFDLTKENMRLGAVQGIVKDADGSTIYDWATEFGQTIPAEVDFDLDNANPASGVLRQKCTVAVRSMTRGLKGLGGNSVRFMAICGDDFWDNLIAHPEVRQTYLNYQAAAALRDPVAWESFNFGGITWTNYRGTDDGSTVAVPAAKAKFFPVGAGIFQECYSPAEPFGFVNTPGLPTYSWVVTDRDRDMWADVEMYSYPLFVCTMPQALYRAKYT